MDLCKQMIQASKDIEDSKSEYQLVTNYLTDIQILEDLTDAERKPILECATQVAKLEKQRTDFLKTKRRLTDTQFAQMQEEEENLPGVIRRLKANEADLDAIKRNMAYLEGKKLEWSMQRSDSAKVQKVTRTAACYLLAVFITLFAFVGILSWYLNRDLQLVFTIMGFAAVGAGAFILIRYQDSTREIRQADVNRNQAITLENRVKIRYVNTKNAVDFICEKYHVRNAKELEFLYGQYQEEAREKETFRKTSDDLDYYTQKNLPGVIRRLKANEADLDAIKRNMAYLEGKKLEWSMQRSDSAKVQKVTRTAACYLLAVFITLFAFVGILSWYLNRDLQLVFTIMGFAAVGAGAFILIRYQDSTREIRQADVNRNQAITLENRVKIRYVNTKNAVDFICEKYHVRNAKELEFLYGQYQEEAREKDTFRKTSDDLDYYTQNLLQYLTRLRMYDTRVWLTHANALVDSREMVELKHELLTRRQKLRARMEYSVGSIHEMKGEALKNMSKLGNNAYQLEQIIRKIEAMNPVFK